MPRPSRPFYHQWYPRLYTFRTPVPRKLEVHLWPPCNLLLVLLSHPQFRSEPSGTPSVFRLSWSHKLLRVQHSLSQPTKTLFLCLRFHLITHIIRFHKLYHWSTDHHSRLIWHLHTCHIARSQPNLRVFVFFLDFQMHIEHVIRSPVARVYQLDIDRFVHLSRVELKCFRLEQKVQILLRESVDCCVAQFELRFHVASANDLQEHETLAAPLYAIIWRPIIP